MGRLVHGGVALGIKHHLRDARAVSQVDEHHHPVVAPPLYPAVQYYRLADVSLIQLAAAVCPDFHATFTFFHGPLKRPPALFSHRSKTHRTDRTLREFQ
jgi:hypothetical protein